MNRQFKLLFFLAAGTILLGSCVKEIASENDDNFALEDVSLEGSWNLLRYVDHTTEEATEWSEYDADIIYQKHLTPTHFVWLRYNSKEENLEGSGGGTYKFDGQVYTENIEFFHPPGSSLLGQNIPFDVKIEGETWLHTGFSKELEFDSERGELVIVDTSRIEEQWQKVDGSSSHKDMLRTWQLTEYKMNATDSIYSKYADYEEYIKLLTPTNFVWVRYHDALEGGAIIGLGSGTWNIGNDLYNENIHAMYPSGSDQVNSSVTFDIDLSSGRWHHKGYIKRVELDDNGNQYVLDSTLIDEIWLPVLFE